MNPQPTPRVPLKQATNAAFDHDYEEFFDLYMELQREAMSSEDFDEAMEALAEERDPEWM